MTGYCGDSLLLRLPLWIMDKEERQIFHVGSDHGPFRWPWSRIMSVRMAREKIPDWLEPITDER